MALYRRPGCKTWTMDFMFKGQRICEPTGMTSRTRAQKVLDNRRRGLEDGSAGIRKRKDPGLLSVAAKDWQETRKPKWAPRTAGIVDNALGHLLPVLGRLLLVDIEPQHVAKYQRARLAEGASNRTVNIEVSTLRQIMRKHGQWARIAPDVTMLAERQDAGHAISEAEESMLVLECGRSRSRILLPFVLLSLETGARYSTVRNLQWRNIDLLNRSITFGKDKTEAGTGRTIPLSPRAFAALEFWAGQFPERKPSHFVFPQESVGGAGTDETFGFTAGMIVSTDPSHPTGSIKTAWQSMKQRTRRHCPECRTGTIANQEKPETGFVCIECGFMTQELPKGLTGLRLHDLRHTFVSRRIAAGKPLPMIGKVVGWKPSTLARMAARYGHFSLDELRDCVDSRPAEAEMGNAFQGSRRFPRRSPGADETSVN